MRIEGVTFLDDPETVLAAVDAADPRRRARGRARGGRGGRAEGEARRGCRRGGRGAEAEAAEPSRARRGLAHAPVPSGRARPRRSTCSSSGLGNPGARVRADAAQRRLDGRRRARAAARRLVPVEVLRPARGGPARRPAGRAAQARDLHERVRALGRGRGAAFFKVPPGRSSSCTTRSTSTTGRLQARMGGGLAGHNGLRSIAQALGTQDFLRLRIGVGRPGRGTGGRSPTTSSPRSSREMTSTRSSRRWRPTRSRRIDCRGPRGRRSARFN